MLDLFGFVQHYDWGGKHFIPKLIGVPNPKDLPFAELWLGAHPKGSAKVGSESAQEDLEALIRAKPEMLGKKIRQNFGDTLPFLLKVLDVNNMLSIQAHPDKATAAAGFAAEERAGIAWNARERVFKDPNDKPEMMLALTDFWLLHGFKSSGAIHQCLKEVPEFEPLSNAFSDVKSLYTFLMTLPQPQINELLYPLQQRLLQSDPTDKLTPEYWAKKAVTTFRSNNGDIDRGICSIFLMNIVYLQPGEAIFQDAGILHAYLEGANVELMGNSDNVFRGGLTTKHIDVPALLKNISYESVIPKIEKGIPRNSTETVFVSPFPAFELSVLHLSDPQVWNHQNPDSLEIFLVLEGSVRVNGMAKSKGDAFILEANAPLTIITDPNHRGAKIVRAYVGNS